MRGVYVCADPGVPVYGRKGSSVHVQAVLGALHKRSEMELYALRSGGDPSGPLREIPSHILGRPGGEAALREKLLSEKDEEMYSILSQRPADFVYERYSLWATAGMRSARDWGVPGILEVNSPLLLEQSAHRSLVDVEGAELSTLTSFTMATHLLAVSDPVKEWILSMGVEESKVRVVRNGVDPERFHPPSFREDEEDFVVGFVGTLKPWHGLPTLLQAFAAARLPHWRLLVVGEGPERAVTEELAAAIGISDVTEFTGAVEPNEVPGLLAQMHVAAAPYEVEDTYFSPLKVYEYLAAGVCTVAARSGQVMEVIEDGVNGLLHSPKDAESLGECFRRLDADEKLRRSLAGAGREVALKHTWDDVAGQILKLVTKR